MVVLNYVQAQSNDNSQPSVETAADAESRVTPEMREQLPSSLKEMLAGAAYKETCQNAFDELDTNKNQVRSSVLSPFVG